MYGDSGYNLNGCIGHYRIKDGKYYNVEIVEKETEVKYYTMTMTHKTDLTNGFRY